MDLQNNKLEFIPVISVILIAETNDLVGVEKAIVSVLNQNCKFRIQITIILKEYNNLIANLCQTYKALFPDKIRFYTRLTADVPGEITILGDYIFICHDYEILSDNKKLTTQCNFLISHPKYKICFHNVTGSGSTIIAEGDYNNKHISLNQIIKYYSPLIRAGDNPLKFNFMLFERDGGMLFERDYYRGLMRCTGGIESCMYR
ncbi:MAG: hypothetical protein RR293_01545 [Bacteroidales bacterium]